MTCSEEAQGPLPLCPAEEFPVGAEVARWGRGLAARPIALGKGSAAHHEGSFLLLRQKRSEGSKGAAQHEGADSHATGVHSNLQQNSPFDCSLRVQAQCKDLLLHAVCQL